MMELLSCLKKRRTHEVWRSIVVSNARVIAGAAGGGGGVRLRYAPGFVPGITIEPDGALWFTQLNGGQVGHITTAGTITQYGAGNGSAIVAGPDGALWFTRYSSDTGNIGRITTSGSFTGYPVPGAYFLDGIAVGPDGALWFTDQDVNTIGRITTT